MTEAQGMARKRGGKRHIGLVLNPGRISFCHIHGDLIHRGQGFLAFRAFRKDLGQQAQYENPFVSRLLPQGVGKFGQQGFKFPPEWIPGFGYSDIADVKPRHFEDGGKVLLRVNVPEVCLQGGR